MIVVLTKIIKEKCERLSGVKTKEFKYFHGKLVSTVLY